MLWWFPGRSWPAKPAKSDSSGLLPAKIDTRPNNNVCTVTSYGRYKWRSRYLQVLINGSERFLRFWKSPTPFLRSALSSVDFPRCVDQFIKCRGLWTEKLPAAVNHDQQLTSYQVRRHFGTFSITEWIICVQILAPACISLTLRSFRKTQNK